MKAGLRSRPAVESIAPFEEDPESLLRSRRKSQKTNKGIQAESCPQPLTHDNLSKFVKSAKIGPADHNLEIEDGVLTEVSDEETSLGTQDTREVFYRDRGYLPSLDEETTAMLNAIAANPASASTMAKKFQRRSPGTPGFELGLDARNVPRKESRSYDPYKEHVINISTQEDSFQETNEEKLSFGLLWKLDQAKCNKPANEALFQRTLMISLVARHCLIYERSATKEPLLDFSVEEPWTCPPMPSRDFYKENTKFLTQPKPDLAVGFCREAVLPRSFWKIMPDSIKRLICYESLDDSGQDKVFHFFTIEAKRSLISPENLVGLHQSLNNASQALHNMFEFFRDAGHEEIFFNKVRFFSVVASNLGLRIRIHRATKVLEDQDLIMKNRPDYPLQFKFQEFSKFSKDYDFDREKTLRVFEKIFHGYEVKELLPLLHEAAKALMEKLRENPEQMKLRQNDHCYLYGQIYQKKPPIVDTSNVDTPTVARTLLAPGSAMSLDEQQSKALPNADQSMRTKSSTPRQSRHLPPTRNVDTTKKRRRGASKDEGPISTINKRSSVHKRQK